MKLDIDSLRNHWNKAVIYGPRDHSEWVHIKTDDRYWPLFISLRESDLEPLVTYAPFGQETPRFTRTVAEFRERFLPVSVS